MEEQVQESVQELATESQSNTDNISDRESELLREVMQKKERLQKAGFIPNYFTHYWKNKKGEVYLFCYEYGYLAKSEKKIDKYVLVKWQEYMES